MPEKASQRNTLYCGFDLVNAAKRSNIDRSLRDSYAGYRNGLGVLVDALRARRKLNGDPQFELVMATGTIRDTSIAATVAYAGNGANRDWSLATTMSEHAHIKTQQFSSAAESLDALQKKIDSVDIAFVENIDETLVNSLPVDFLRIPAWIKQRVRLEGDWIAQVRSLRRGTRQEVSRVLRKYGYECRLTRRDSDISRFYDQLYRPYISSLYGKSAIIVDRDRFIRECRRGELLQLIQDNSIVASALLRPVGKTMAIVWSGMDPMANNKRLPGATDALDYFSLLYAHLKGCRWLDFGPSRADIADGTLRYKRKWGSVVTRGYVTQPSVYLACNDRDGAAREFLRQHAFIADLSGRLTAITAMTKDDATTTAQKQIEQLITPGIAEYRVISFSPLQEALRSKLLKIHTNVTLIEADSLADAMNIASLE